MRPILLGRASRAAPVAPAAPAAPPKGTRHRANRKSPLAADHIVAVRPDQV
jgi:hypothetical protein